MLLRKHEHLNLEFDKTCPIYKIFIYTMLTIYTLNVNITEIDSMKRYRQGIKYILSSFSTYVCGVWCGVKSNKQN